jgi:uncharacterized membrane protein
MTDKQVVLALFDTEAAADSAVANLKTWEKTSDEVKLGAIGVLVMDENGKIKTHKMGSRSIGKGAGIGLILAMLTPVGLVGGVVGGALLGILHHKGLGLSEQDRDRIATELANGKAAVGVLTPTVKADAISAKLVELGGKSEVHDASDEALEHAASVDTAPAAPAAP